MSPGQPDDTATPVTVLLALTLTTLLLGALVFVYWPPGTFVAFVVLVAIASLVHGIQKRRRKQTRRTGSRPMPVATPYPQ